MEKLTHHTALDYSQGMKTAILMQAMRKVAEATTIEEAHEIERTCKTVTEWLSEWEEYVLENKKTAADTLNRYAT